MTALRSRRGRRLSVGAERARRLAKGCRWLDKDFGGVWEVVRVFRRAVQLVSVHTGTRLTIHDSARLLAAESWRPLRGAEFKRSFEIVRGDPAVKLVRSRLPSAEALRAAGERRAGERAAMAAHDVATEMGWVPSVPKSAQPDSVGVLVRGGR